MWTFLFLCLNCLVTWSEKTEHDYREPMFFTTFVDWVIGRVEALGAAALLFVRYPVQLVVSSSDPGLYQTSAVSGKLSTKSNGSVLQVFVPVMARPDE